LFVISTYIHNGSVRNDIFVRSWPLFLLLFSFLFFKIAFFLQFFPNILNILVPSIIKLLPYFFQIIYLSFCFDDYVFSSCFRCLYFPISFEKLLSIFIWRFICL